MIVFLLAALLFNLVSPVSAQAVVSPPVYLLKWGSYGIGNSQFDTPMGIAVNTSLGRVYVVDSYNNRVQYFSLTGVYIGQSGEYGFNVGQFYWPQAIAINQTTGQVYVADTINSRIQILNQDLGSPVAFGSYGTADGQFRRPSDVAVDADGNFYVADTFNHRIQKFDGDSPHALMLNFGGYGTGNGQFNRPGGVAVDNTTGDIYVVDENHRVQRFAADGTFISAWGSFGTLEGQFNTPRDIVFDSAGNLYVSDTNNQRIQKFTSAGVFLTQWGGYGTANGRFNNPWGMAALGSDEIYVTDSDNNRVQRFETNQAPTAISLTPAAVFENRPAGTLVGGLATADSNLGDTHTYTLVAGIGDTDNAAFALSGPTLMTAAAFDFETRSSFSVRVRTTDSGGMTFEQALTVTIANDNDTPVVSGGPFIIDENSAVSTPVGQVIVTDQDTANTGFTYQITGGNTGGAFTINAAGQILVASSAALNYETNPTFTLTVQATDDGSPTGSPLSGTGTILINVNPVNEAPALAPLSASVAENSAPGTAVGTMLGSDPDAGQTLSYAITGGNSLGGFTINPSTGAITVASSAPLDRETNPTFVVTVTVTDNGTPVLSATASATITLTDVNEFDPAMPNQTVSIPENSLVGTSVATVSATDGDTGSTFTYAITAGNGLGAFAINPTSGAITVASQTPLDFETNPTFTLTVQATDSGVPPRTGTASVTVNLTNANEAPVVPAQTMTVPENSASGTSVGTVSVVDLDSTDWTFAVAGGTGMGVFAVDSDTGAVTVANGAALNFEATPSYTLTVEATDNAVPGLSGSGTVTINLTNVNEAPTVPAQTLTVAENSANGTNVGSVSATDPDAGSSFTFLETGGTGTAVFDVSAAGVVTVVNGLALDFETNPSYTLTVQATDNGAPALNATGTVTINVTNVNEAPVLNDITYTVDENSANGTLVGTLAASDPDTGGTLTYTILSVVPNSAPPAFGINSGTGAITVTNRSVLNFEAAPTFTVNVRVADNGTPQRTDTAVVTINLNNVNDAPQVANQGFSVAENSALGTSVGTVAASDQDLPPQTLTYAITAGNTGNAFAINPATGEITVQTPGALNRETTPSFALTVSVTDPGPLSTSATVTITLTDVNEPPVVNNATFSLPENSPTATLVGTVTAADPENTALMWSITGGTGMGVFAIHPISGQIAVADPNPLNFEITSSFTLTVRATDPGALWGEGTVTINLTNVNEPPVVGSATFSLPENSLVSTVVSVADPDHSTFTWSITNGNTGTAFFISPANGEISVINSAPLNFETTSAFVLTVRATDGGGAWGEGTVTINLTDVNEPPSVPAQTLTVPENSVNGFPVGTILVNDPDAGSSFTFTELPGPGASVFDVSPVGLVTVADSSALNYESGPTFYPYLVQVMDNGIPGLVTPAVVTINVTNVNEAPVLNDITYTVNENSVNGTTVGTLLAADVDAGSSFTYTILNVSPFFAPPAFGINSGTGAILVTNRGALNFEANPTFTVNVRVADNGNPQLTDTAVVTINLNDVNDAPIVSGTAFALAENSPLGTVVGTVTATDQDLPPQTWTWAITAGNGSGAFAIDPVSGQITVANPTPLNFETTPSFTLTVQAIDTGIPTALGSGTVTVNLTNVNEPPVVNNATFSLLENSPAATVVGTVTAADTEDTTFTWSITGGNAVGAFTINPTSGQITVANPAPLDLETNPSFVLTVRAADPGTLWDEGTVTINLTNANEPPVVSDATFSLPENSAVGTSVGTLSIADPDSTTFTWSITGGNGLGAFSINPATGLITVANSAPLNFETTPTFILTVRAADAGGLADVGTATINLTNMNDAPVVQNANFFILETAANGSVIGTVTAADADAGQTLTYSLTAGNTGGAFAIDPVSGLITVANNTGFNHQTTPPFNLTVQATDNHATNPLSGTGTVVITIMPAADLELTSFTGPVTALSGSTGLYTVQVSNIGPGAASSSTVEVTLPAPLTMTASGSTAGCTFAAQVVTCPLGTVNSGATVSVNVAVLIPSSAVGDLNLQAEVVPGGGDLDIANHTASLTVAVVANSVVVDDDFESGADAGWSTDQRSTTPIGGRNFLGEFANQRITFTANDLAAHDMVKIEFDLFVIRSWDGNNLIDGPDRWLMDLDGVTLTTTTFSNWNDVLRPQSYPGEYPAASYPSKTGAEESNTLGYLYGGDWLEMDAVYHFEMMVDHSAADLIVGLEGMGLSGIADESWGVDNFRVTLYGQQQDFKVFLPMLTR